MTCISASMVPSGRREPAWASGYPVDILQRADDLVHLGQDYYLVGIAAGNYRVCQRIGVCQGLGLAVLTGILIGDDGGLYALSSIFLVFMIRSVSGLPKPS